ncbi:MAG: DUF2244 domain-containing protein [Rhizobiaceae bacterium]|jgi:uncharacterized membrane protein|nr:DUF2244 domain-containing protein [Rhizobiaceae bacterium]
MTSVAIDAPDAPIFEACLVPHRSMSNRGALCLVAFISILWGVMSLSFVSMGAWPVLAFFGLDIVLLAWLVWLNLRDARRREEVSVSRTALEIRRFAPNGFKREQHRFNPLGTRLHVERHEEFGVTKLTLHNRDRVISIGDFLDPDSKESFAKAFGAALARAKR